MIKNWLKIYWYHTVKNKMYFLLTVLGLAIGISAMILSSLYYLEESSYDQWNPNKDDVFVVESKIDKDISWMKLPYSFGEKLKEVSPQVVDYTYMFNYYEEGVFIINGEKKAYNRLLDVQSNFFDFFPFEVVKGDKKKPFLEKKSAVIRDKYVKYLFGDKDPIGEVIRYEDENYVVSGVFTSGDKRSSVVANILVNSQDEYVVEQESWGNYNGTIWLKLNDISKKSQVEDLIEKLLIENLYAVQAKANGKSLEDYLQDNPFEKGYVLHDLSGQRLIKESNLNGTPEGGANVRLLYTMIGLSVLILVLSVFNYINMVTAQTISRGKEVGVRKAVGATKNNLWTQGIFESLLTTLFAIIIAMVIVEFVLPSLQGFLNTRMEFRLLDFLPWLLLITFGVVVIVGTIPAIFLANFKTLEVLKGEITRSKKGLRLKQGMLIVQFGIACFFISGAWIVQQQITYMLQKDLGFKGDQVVSIPYFGKIPWEKKREVYFSLKEEMSKVKGVEGVSTSALMWDAGASGSSIKYGIETSLVENGGMDYNFLDMLNIKIKEGRQLSADLASDTISNILLNESVVKRLGMTDPIGKKVDWNNYEFTVVGVVQDYHLYSLKREYSPAIYMHLNTVPWVGNTINFLFLKIDMNNIEETMSEVQKIWERRDISDEPFSYQFVDKTFARTFNSTLKERNVFLILNGIVIFIALFGLYSLASFDINGRLKEVAIRKVLGASRGGLLRQLSKQYLVMGIIGFVVSIFPSYYFLNKWLSNYAFRIEISVTPFIVTFVVIGLLTLFIVLIKAYSATRVNVLKYIKYE